jgi:hypothetical protein
VAGSVGGLSHRLHFCTADRVRTCEWDTHEVGCGHMPFPLRRWDEIEQ